jgi:hypothetical protein
MRVGGWTLATGEIFDMSDVKFYHIFLPNFSNYGKFMSGVYSYLKRAHLSAHVQVTTLRRC